MFRALCLRLSLTALLLVPATMAFGQQRVRVRRTNTSTSAPRRAASPLGRAPIARGSSMARPSASMASPVATMANRSATERTRSARTENNAARRSRSVQALNNHLSQRGRNAEAASSNGETRRRNNAEATNRRNNPEATNRRGAEAEGNPARPNQGANRGRQNRQNAEAELTGMPARQGNRNRGNNVELDPTPGLRNGDGRWLPHINGWSQIGRNAITEARRVGNCVNCAIAVDTNLAGRPSVAMPGDPTNLRNALQETGVTIRAVLPANSPDELRSAISELPAGTRGIVRASRGPAVGHAFNFVRTENGVFFLDGQTGRPASLSGYQNFEALVTGRVAPAVMQAAEAAGR